MSDSLIHLQSAGADIVIKTRPFAEIVYWGPHLSHFSPQDADSLTRPVANGRLDVDSPVTLMAELGHGLFGAPGIEGHRQGLDASPIFATSKVRHEGQTLTLVSEDPQAGLRLQSEIALDASGVLSVRHGVTNLRASPWQVDRLAVTLPVAERAREVMAFHGRWIREFQPHRLTLEHDSFVLENRRGRTSHEHFPALITGSRAFSEMQGEVWGVHLAWSGNHRLRAEVKTDGRRYLQAEALYLPGEMALAEGETLWTPYLYASYSANGLNGMSQQFHRYLRERIIRFPGNKPRPVHLNTWEGIYFDHDPDYIMRMADEAAALGVERFIIDDGWFKGRNDDWAALGDWYLDEKKYPYGLTPVIDHVKSLGMEFGIWVEPEMINPDSDLYRAHPDWVLALPGYTPLTGRHQFVLNLNIPEAFDYLLERMSWLLGEHAVDYVKWDMNRSMADVYAGNLAYDYVLGVYDFMERLVTRYPDILLEGCSGGGGRFDAGMLYYSPQIWCSDNTDAINRTRIQYGTSFFYPVSSMGAHVSAVPNHQTGRVTSLKTRGITAMAGTFGYELNPALLSDEEKEEIREQIKTFKKYEMLINEGTYWRLTSPFEDEVAAWMSVSRAKDRALVSVVRLYAEANAATYYVKLKGLESDAVYIEENTGRQYTGAALMNAGIPLPFATKEYEAYQFSFIRLDEAKKLYDEIKKVCGNLKLSEADTADSSSDKRIVISIYGGSGSGKTTIAAALQQYFLNDNTACYVLTGDNYPHRIPMRNDEERLNVYNESGEDGLRGYLGTPEEIDFDRINKELSEFKAGKDIIEIKHMGREDGDISYDETDFTGIKVLILEWTHGGSEYLKGVDIPVFLESSPEETKARRIKRGRDENAASPFICRVVELEQEKLDLQGKNARIVVGKDGKVYEQ